MCPLKNICDSVGRGYVGESRGVEWYRGCFSLGKPQLKTPGGIIRTCNYCPDYDKKEKKCERGDEYKIESLESEKIKLLKYILKDF